MVQIWEMDRFPYGDPRLPQWTYPPKRLNHPDELTKRTGIVYYQLAMDDAIALAKRISIMKKDWKFIREDTFILDHMATIDFKDKITELYEETRCGEDQARMILEGAAYFDVEVEAEEDLWLRICMQDGDLIIIPRGKAYKMTTTNKNYVKMKRFFKDEIET